MMIFGDESPECFEGTRSSPTSLTLRRSVPSRAELRIENTDTGRAELAHARASRIETGRDGFTTFSDAWFAQYRRIAGGYKLESVVARSEAAAPVDIKPLGGGLFARRAADRWTIGTDSDARSRPWPFEALTGGKRSYLSDDDSILEASASWARRSSTDGTVQARWPDAQAAPVALAGAFRSGELVVVGAERFRLARELPLARVDDDHTPRERGSLLATTAGSWSISLAQSGDELQVAYGGATVAVSSGALSMDFAIATGAGGSTTWLIDRLGASHLDSDAEPWNAHAIEAREAIAGASTSRARAMELGGSLRRFISTDIDGHPVALGFPDGVEGVLEWIEGGAPMESWTRGSQLEILMGADGQVHFSRADANRPEWFHYPPVAKDDCCRAGRFAFDSPNDLLLAARPAGTIPEACVEMKVGWEWPASVDRMAPPSLSTERPNSKPPEFGPAPREVWIENTDLTLDHLNSVEARAGTPIIWYPFGDRLFHVGEKSVVWVELGSRWHGRSLE